MKVVLSNGVEFPIKQANVRYSELSDDENKYDREPYKYPVVEFMTTPEMFVASVILDNKDYFDEFTLHFGDNQFKTFTSFELDEGSIRESYSDESSTVMFIASSI